MARKIIGITFIIAAIIGLILSIGGIVLVWVVREPLTTNLVNTIDLIGTTLEATSSGLSAVDETLSSTISNISTLESTIQTASNSIDDSVPMIESISGLLSGNLPGAIEATQTGLTTLQDAAGSIESTLKLLTSIPFLPIERYAPEVAFTDALEDISENLDPISQSLVEMESTLNTTQGNMVMIATELRIISQNISDLNSSLSDIQLVIERYQEVITTAQDKVDSIRINLGMIITVTAWIFTIIFIWLGIAQLGLLTQGIERVDWHPWWETDDESPLASMEEDNEIEIPADDDNEHKDDELSPESPEGISDK
jgi:peptidoglycan hydrolase CwlO-like protein